RCARGDPRRGRSADETQPGRSRPGENREPPLLRRHDGARNRGGPRRVAQHGRSSMGLRPRMVVSRDHGRKVTARRRLARFHKLKRVKNASIITTPSLLPVPANADFFIEGPFGGDTGHYTFPEPY